MSNTIGIAYSEFNTHVTQHMRDVAVKRAEELDLKVKKVLKVPGAFELPLVVKKLLEEKDIEGVVVLGAVRQGDTDHDQIVAQNAARACMDLMIEYNKPIGMGISGPKMNMSQAEERAEPFAKRAVEAVAQLITEMKK